MKQTKERQEYLKKYRRTHREQIRPVARARYLKNKEKWIKYGREYQRKHPYKTLSPEAQRKNHIRARTFQIYGAPPKGYERHHLNYNSPHNFILVPRAEHRKLHWKENTKT